LPAWKQYAGKSEFSSLNVADALSFMKKLMSLSPEDQKRLKMHHKKKHHKKGRRSHKLEKTDEEIERERETAF